jgi:hypothetical protein
LRDSLDVRQAASKGHRGDMNGRHLGGEPASARAGSLAETNPDIVALAKRLARRKPKGGKMSLRSVSAELAARGHLNERGKPFNPKSVAVLLTA